MTLDAERLKELREVVRRVFVDRFPGVGINRVALSFDKDMDGDDMLRIAIVVDDASPKLDRERLVGFVRHLRSALADVEREEFPIVSFVSSKDAEMMNLESA